MRNEIKFIEHEKQRNTDIDTLTMEKMQLQSTLQTLTEEVEFLSKSNDRFLQQLKTKDFYTAYKDCVDELNKLREAHTILIGMIQNHHITIGTSQGSSSYVYKNDKAS